MQLYHQSNRQYSKNSFFYLIYGLNVLTRAFSELCAIFKRVKMLNTNIDKILMEKKSNWNKKLRLKSKSSDNYLRS